MHLTFILFLDNNKYVFEHLKPISAADCVKLFFFSWGGVGGVRFFFSCGKNLWLFFLKYTLLPFTHFAILYIFIFVGSIAVITYA